jgi:transcriptional regulator with XRE-family HTH domain
VDASKAFGKVLRRLRRDRDLSQENLANAVGMERSYISKLEKGDFQPKLKTILALSDELGIRASELVDRVEDLMKEE